MVKIIRLEGGELTKRIASIVVLLAIAAAAVTFKAWWNDEHEGRLKHNAEEELRQQQQEWNERFDSLGTAAQAKIDSLGIWLKDQAQEIRDGIANSEPIEPPSVEERATRAWAEAVGALPEDLTAYEKKVAVQELRETLEEQFGLTKDMVERITGKP